MKLYEVRGKRDTEFEGMVFGTFTTEGNARKALEKTVKAWGEADEGLASEIEVASSNLPLDSIIIDGVETHYPSRLSIPIPNGSIVVEEKGTPTEYPGVYVMDGNSQQKNLMGMIACVEYDTCAEQILTTSYMENCDEVVSFTHWESGETEF